MITIKITLEGYTKDILDLNDIEKAVENLIEDSNFFEDLSHPSMAIVVTEE